MLFSPIGAVPAKSKDRLTIQVSEPVVVTRQPSRVWKDNRWLWFPQISRFSTGELMVGFWMSNDERYPEGSDFGGYCISRDGGRTWGWRRLRGSPAWNRHAFEDGSLIEVSWLTVPVEPDRPKRVRAILTRFRDGGRWMSQEDATVSFPRPVRVEPGITGMPDEPPSKDLRFAEMGQRPNSSMYFARSMMAMPDRRLLATMYGVWEGDVARRSVVVQSTDEGKTWTYLSTLCDPPTVEAVTGYENQGCEEASLVRLADGRLFSIFRTKSRGMLLQSWSSDEGKTWTRPVSAGVGSVLPKLLLLSNGVLACSYGRPGVHLMFSLDGTGREWTHHTEVPLEGRASTCYTDMLEMEPGEILLVFDTSYTNSWRRGEVDVRLARVSVSRE
jgi:hypothetical protein